MRNKAASPIILRISFMLTFPVPVDILASLNLPAFREKAQRKLISLLDSLNSLLPVIRHLTMSLPILLSSFVSVSMMFLLTMYVIIPLLTKLLRPWLTKKRLF